MDRAPDTVFNVNTKRCLDCAEVVDDRGTPGCGRKQRTNPVTGAPSFLDCYSERAFDVPNGCGPKAIYFRPTYPEAGKREQRRRLQLQIEAAITELKPDSDEAEELQQAIKAAVRS